MVVQAPGLTAVGFAVAGGRSLRMGRDKALLPWRGTTLLDATLERLGQVCSEVRILSGAQARYLDHGVPVDPDAVTDAGPLGGLVTGLGRLGQSPGAGVFLAIDVPLVPVALLRHLVSRAEGFDAVVPVTADGPHPLCAVYRRACLEPIRRRLAAGERKMTCFWPDVRVRELKGPELEAFGDPAEMLRNLNTPEDYAAIGLKAR